MATIVIRDIPEDAFETIRGLAQAAGQSIESYLRDQVLYLASRRTKAEAWAAVDSALAAEESPGPTLERIVADVAEDRR